MRRPKAGDDEGGACGSSGAVPYAVGRGGIFTVVHALVIQVLPACLAPRNL